jgi:hypothetical protein
MSWEYSDKQKAWIAERHGLRVEDIDWDKEYRLETDPMQEWKAALLPEIGQAAVDYLFQSMLSVDQQTVDLVFDMQMLLGYAQVHWNFRKHSILHLPTQARFQDTNPEVFKIFSYPINPLDPELKQKYPSLSELDAKCQFLTENGAGDLVEMFRKVWGSHHLASEMHRSDKL